MKKQALFDFLEDAVGVAAAAVATAAFLSGMGGGMLVGKLTEPGEYDKKNLQKEHELARLHRDNQTQRILFDREQAERKMRNIRAKSMRALG